MQEKHWAVESLPKVAFGGKLRVQQFTKAVTPARSDAVDRTYAAPSHALMGYTAAEHTLQFTLGMKWARLLMAIVTSVGAGAMTGWISRSGRWAPLIVGSVVLAMFLPVHIAVWSKFPVWYHLTFLLPIVPAVLVGALLPRGRNKDLNKAYSTPR